MNYTFPIFLILLFLFPKLGYAQHTLEDSVQAIQISALKIETDSKRSTVQVQSIQVDQNNLQNLNLQEQINSSPGLYSMNANNYAQDLRISIRGFGARSPFGIRGIKLIVDGVPETTPDGLGQLDNLNLSLIDNIEIIKGPASGLYGNASGGVIKIDTRNLNNNNLVNADFAMGSFGYEKINLTLANSINNTQLLLNTNHTKSDGYRANNEYESTMVQFKMKHTFSKNIVLDWNTSFVDSPTANDPGGINFESIQEDRQQARFQNIQFQSGESISQFKSSIALDYKFNTQWQCNSYGFISTREFNGRLPFENGGMINLNRMYHGLGADVTFKNIFDNSILTTKLGFESASQIDDRKRFLNLEGLQGRLTLNQSEQFMNQAIFLINQFNLRKWILDFNLRYDINQIEINDDYLFDGDQSGNQTLNAFNYGIGLNYSISSALKLFTNYRTSFETPVLSELSANPSGTGGFNDSLDPQTAINLELGINLIVNKSLEASLTVFNIKTENEIIPFENQMDNRTFFQNAGQTSRRGIETNIKCQINPYLHINGFFTYNDIKFQEFIIGDTDLKGKYIPGIPKSYGGIITTFEISEDSKLAIESLYRNSLFVNNTNSEEDPSYFIFNAKLYSKMQFRHFEVTPYIGINNLGNTLYNDNIRINAFGSRYYEPAPERNFYFGLRFGF